jgi:putative ATP-binding cassette transporter
MTMDRTPPPTPEPLADPRDAAEPRASVAKVAMPPLEPEAVPDEPRRSGFSEFASLARDVKGARRMWLALLIVAGILAIIAASTAGQVRLNTWYGDFFNAIERKSLDGVGQQLWIFLVIVAVLLCFVVAQTFLHETLKIRLREMITARLLDDWLAAGRAYRLGIASPAGVNPDQRMQEDVRHLSELSADLGVNLTQQMALLVTFIGVLWVLSERVALPIGGQLVVVPGYMVWCALVYAGIGSLLAWRIGRPLIGLNVARYAREAEFRFALVRVSESAEAIALYGGERDERRFIDAQLARVLAAMRRVVFAVSRLTWITSGYGWIAIVVPTVVALPGYFYGGLTLGGLMMVVGAFTQVQVALRWVVDNYAKIADWRASLHRVVEFHEAQRAIDEIEENESRIVLADHPERKLAFRDVSVLLADGSVLIKEASAEFGPGERVLIKGESGAGKSTLFRAIAGLWPWGTGTILLPPRHTMMFMPQRPYLPLGTLRNALAYPSAPDAFSAEALGEALTRVGLNDFVPMLERDERWDKLMSVGEQQRLAFARLLLHRPLWVFLDEATAALDEANQERVMSLFDGELAGATLISIGHRPGLERFHARTLELVPSTSGARLRRKRRRPEPPRSFWAMLRPYLTGRREAERLQAGRNKAAAE